MKKQRMLQGEIEKTIKTFSQVQDARVQIINGKESAFSNETEPGSAAVTITLKPGTSLDPSQVRSIMSLVSASCENVPKQNVQVVDQNMNLLSEGLYDENGKEQSGSSNGVYVARKAEKDLDSDLERAIKSVLGPMFGNDNVLVQVNADLNFDSKQTTEIKVDPNKVAIKESKKLNTQLSNSLTQRTLENQKIIENLKLMKLEDPLDIDDDKIHIEQHTKFIIQDNNKIDQKFITLLLKHIQKHKEKLNKEKSLI